ncbi:peroxiredoxin [Fulvivirgaceae bacterium BMA12]|uniref:thioredoxin-dependent peroxiredoxin n=1 Tax=Agaribacillus aureus TaxID=3051825 RepID=A0ABT8L1K4_9BACT|nr:peroxiredoxin [Fulvivirgaceae bacterium BMA12]
MALKLQTQAPDFTLPSTSGTDFTLSTHLGTACIIYFYPKDFTPGCTREACEFRDQFAAFRNLDIPVYGISRDSISTHIKFKEKHDLPFDLLADVKGQVARQYQALMPIIGITKRITYLLGKDHKIVAVCDSLFDFNLHISEMKEKIMTELS